MVRSLTLRRGLGRARADASAFVNSLHECASSLGARSCAAERAGERGGIDRQLEALLPIDLDHRDPDAVLELERVVARDVDLLEGERCPLAFGENDLARLVTEPAAWPRVHPHPAHRGGWYKVLVQEEDRQDLPLHGLLA